MIKWITCISYLAKEFWKLFGSQEYHALRNGMQAKLVSHYKWVWVSLGALYIQPWVTSRQNLVNNYLEAKQKYKIKLQLK